MNKTKMRQFGILFFLHAFQTGILAPVISLLFLSKGIRIDQLAVVMGIFAGTVLLLEIPTGVLADLFGRKKTFLLSICFSAVSILIFLFAANIIHIAVGVVIYGTSRALSSGSLEALFIDEVITLEGREGLVRASSGLSIFESLGLTFGAVLGGFLPTISRQTGVFSSLYDLNLLARLTVTLSVGIMTWLLIIDPGGSKQESSAIGQLKMHLRLSLELLRKETKLLLLFLSVFSTGIFFFSIETYWQPQLITLLPDDSHLWILGVAAFFYFASALLGTLISKRLLKSKKINANIVYPVGRILLALSLAMLASQVHFQSYILFFALVYLFLGVSNVPESVLMNELIPNRYRASILSLNSFILQAGALGASFFCARFLVSSKIPVLWLITAAILAMACVFFIILLVKNKNRQESTTDEVEQLSETNPAMTE